MPGEDGDVEGDVCANATLLTRAAAATIIIVLYIRLPPANVLHREGNGISCAPFQRDRNDSFDSLATAQAGAERLPAHPISDAHCSKGSSMTKTTPLLRPRQATARPLTLTLIGTALAALAFLVSRALRQARRDTTAPALSHSITIDKPRKALYRYWRDFSNLPDVIDGLQRVEKLDSRRWRWVMDGPLGQTVEWEAEIIDDQPNERIAWRATDRRLANGGWVEFRDAGTRRGTEVRAFLVGEPPASQVGPTLADLFRRDPAEQIRDALWNLKKRLEGESADA